MKIALAQINPIIGDLKGNRKKVLAFLDQARAAQCQLVVFPEMALTGCPPADLLAKIDFLETQYDNLEKIAQTCKDLSALVGFVELNQTNSGKKLFNGAAFLSKGRIRSKHHKVLMPTYDVFDEDRYFEPGKKIQLAQIQEKKCAVTICEDIWNEPGFKEISYVRHPLEEAMQLGAQVLFNLSASPFHLGKDRQRIDLGKTIAKKYQVPVFYVNMVGGNDSLLFDGGSFVVDPKGQVCAQAKQFEEELLIVDVNWPGPKKSWTMAGPIEKAPQGKATQARKALVLGLKDYAKKCGFEKVILGLSGGIDSAVTAALAVEALGPDQVWGLALPSRFSSKESVEDARDLAKNLNIRFDVLPLQKTFQGFLDTLQPFFKDLPPDVAEENLQARIRGTLLMALSNKFGHLLLSTGNKSEMAVGYCTLYGDMNGGLAVIGDVPKTLVYELAHEINKLGKIIPQSTIEKAPSAELKPNQTDQDTLPDYAILDQILAPYVEQEKGWRAISEETGFPPDLVTQVIRMVDRAEYKRRQAPPALRITPKAFGLGRRLPISQQYKLERKA